MNSAEPQQHVVIVGNGMIGHRFIEYMLEASPTCRITAFGEEPRPAYDRVRLSEYFSGSTVDDLSLLKEPWDPRVSLQTGVQIKAIDPDQKSVVTANGERHTYDALVIATGSFPFVPPIPGKDQPHCHVYRTIEDLDEIRASGSVSRRGVVVGGGLLGLEAANALRNMSLETHVVEFAPQLMSVQLDGGGGEMLRAMVQQLGVCVHTGRNTSAITSGSDYRYRMEFADGEHLETDMIVFSAGIRPQDALARDADIKVGERGGIVIDQRCATSANNVYAIGECALYEERIFGLVAPGYEMAKVAATQIARHEPKEFTGADMSTKLKLLGLDVASIGDAHGKTPGARNCVYVNEQDQIYKKLVLSNSGKKLLGAVLIGDAGQYGTLLQTMLNDLAVPANAESLILPGGSDAVGSNLDALPESAQICSCHAVDKGMLVGAMQDGATTIGALKGATKAGTGCGGCVPLVNQLLAVELPKLGLSVSTDLCEHFAHTRQALYHLIRFGQLRSFADVLAKHGRGRGCDICKPTIASILATCWNDHILKPQHAALQDTNDHFLANMQKNGTYSIVPRIAGGEITPDKLIALGTVAKKYDLYTKITGGQRVDLFGAQVHELPMIWEELIAAGFETGHAYGKAVRTVKSCVGSTWCRYGVLDSVRTAIEIENRYKGLRAPHKLKFAVSGCTRECAEAQSKDVGVIATEQGWNLYVCGNGGMRPRHADLFATGLDDATLVRYIDRFLMFYVRTADRLQRTSVWLEGMEGGLEYIREVVINDSLGIAAELEAEMAQVIESYQCEWKTAVTDPEQRQRFRTYVNADAADQTVRFVQERGQRRPASESDVHAQESTA